MTSVPVNTLANDRIRPAMLDAKGVSLLLEVMEIDAWLDAGTPDRRAWESMKGGQR